MAEAFPYVICLPCIVHRFHVRIWPFSPFCNLFVRTQQCRSSRSWLGVFQDVHANLAFFDAPYQVYLRPPRSTQRTMVQLKSRKKMRRYFRSQCWRAEKTVSRPVCKRRMNISRCLYDTLRRLKVISFNLIHEDTREIWKTHPEQKSVRVPLLGRKDRRPKCCASNLFACFVNMRQKIVSVPPIWR